MEKKFLFCAFLIFPLFLNAQTAYEFLETLNVEFRNLQHLQIDYLSNVVHRNGDDLQMKSIELETAASSAVKKIGSLPQPENDKGLQKIALETFEKMGDRSKRNFDELIFQKAGCTDCFAAEELRYNEMKAISEDVDKSFKVMQNRIAEFAKDNNIKLVDTKDEFDVIITKVNRINNYLQLLNLCTAQAHFASENVVKLLNENMISEAFEALSFFKKELKEAQKRLKSISQIKEDAFCLKKVQMLLDFYQKMADEIYPQMLAAFDKNGEITQTSSLNTYNSCINKINIQLPPKISDYEQTKAALLQKNVPKPVKEIKG